MKVTYLNRKSIWRYLSDFSQPKIFASPLAIKVSPYNQNSKSKIVVARKRFYESKVRSFYKRLEDLHHRCQEEFAIQKRQKLISENLSALEEQNWFIQYLQQQNESFTEEELSYLILNYDHRENYIHYLESDHQKGHLEIFVYNYLLHSLSHVEIQSVFFYFYHKEDVERSYSLKQLFNCITAKQALALFYVLRKETFFQRQWVEYCQVCVEVMHNAQIKETILLLPTEIENFALEKLYPCEILEVVDLEVDEKKKRYLIDKVLAHYKVWWSSFSHDEIKTTYHALLDKLA